MKKDRIRFAYEAELRNLLTFDGIETFFVDGVMNFVDYRDRQVHVPTQDHHTKQVINLLAVQMNQFFKKYPKLRE